MWLHPWNLWQTSLAAFHGGTQSCPLSLVSGAPVACHRWCSASLVSVLLLAAHSESAKYGMYNVSFIIYIAETYVFPLNVILVKLTYKINFLTWILYYCSDFVERTCSESVDISLCTWDLRELNIHVTFLRKPAIQPAMVSLHQGKHLMNFT